MTEGLTQANDMSDIELFDAPLCQDILRQMSIDVAIFDQQNFEHRSPLMDRQLFGAAATSWPIFLPDSKYSLSYCFNKENAESPHADIRQGT